MKLRFTPDAADELDRVLTDIATASPGGAKRVQARIRVAIERLTSYPHSGSQTDLPTVRRVVAVPYPYLIFYEAGANEVVILGIRHAARDPASMPDAP